MESIVSQSTNLRESMSRYIDSDAQLDGLESKIIYDVSFYNTCRSACDEYRGSDIVVPEIMNFIVMCTIRNMVAKKFGFLTQDSDEFSEKCVSISLKSIRKACTILFTVFYMGTTIPERNSPDDSDSDSDSDDVDGIFGDEEEDEDEDEDEDGTEMDV
jgi:hypothetical protein